MDTDVMTISEAAVLVRRTVKTLQRWDRTGILRAKRTRTGRRYYTERQLNAFLGIKPEEGPKKRSAAYLRVSSQAQRPDLVNQRIVVAQFCRAKGITDVEYVEEIKGGLNFTRPKFSEIMDD